ncbi:hypothetical protein LJR225_000768 [Phenylobacterium sp. LjRoot225]|uniref:hypothetical protein n=1 Tax=Phenylobacterium sp. LjRoot225 TaxID=3342285 RepID=UPI003ECF448D
MTSAGGVQTCFRRRTAFAAAIATIALLGATSALADQDPVDLQVIDRDTGQPLRVWRHHGRLFIAGEPGKRYGLRVTNHTDGRVLVVLSVDGVNILTGETASYDQRGYVFTAHRSYDINGWRKSNTEVAAFSFAPLPQSYAARTGRPNDVGVIGMAVFKEKFVLPVPADVSPPPEPVQRDEARRAPYGPPKASHNVPTIPPLPVPPVAHRIEEPVVAGRTMRSPRDSLAPSQPEGGVVARRPDEKLGTAHGAREWSVATVVRFERATRYPQSIRQIEYDTYANLAASGVIPASPYADRRPRPFPSKSGRQGYVPDPPPEF